MNVEELVSKLNNAKEVSPKRGHQRSFIAQCPAHDDSSPSLSVDLSATDNILIKCWAGCGAAEVVESVGMSLSDLMPDSDYESHRFRRSKDLDFHELHLDICKSNRMAGRKQTKQENVEELASLLAIKRRGV